MFHLPDGRLKRNSIQKVFTLDVVFGFEKINFYKWTGDKDAVCPQGAGR